MHDSCQDPCDDDGGESRHGIHRGRTKIWPLSRGLCGKRWRSRGQASSIIFECPPACSERSDAQVRRFASPIFASCHGGCRRGSGGGLRCLVSPVAFHRSVGFQCRLCRDSGSDLSRDRFTATPRSFWLAFAVTTAGFLAVHELSGSRYVTDDIFTRQLPSVIDDLLPEVVVTGEPNTTAYFRDDSNRRPIFFHRFDQSGRRSVSGFMSEEEAQDKGALGKGTTLADLPHLDHQPAAAARQQLLPFLLAAVSGLMGGLLASGVRRWPVRGGGGVGGDRG